MVFNILIDNTDDHEKNHAFLRQADGSYVLAPAFDVLPTAQGLGYQLMRVGAMGNESSVGVRPVRPAAGGSTRHHRRGVRGRRRLEGGVQCARRERTGHRLPGALH